MIYAEMQINHLNLLNFFEWGRNLSQVRLSLRDKAYFLIEDNLWLG